MTLVDSNVLIDVMTDDPRWYVWSVVKIREAAQRGPVVINDIVYAESSIRFERMDEFETALATVGVTVKPIQRIALFLAGKAFAQYRALGGLRTNVLPDFFIGAHAVAENLPLLTRDTRRYRTYFPTLALITPDEN